VGEDHGCILLDDGSIRCWGRNHGGQLGTGDTTERQAPVQVVGLAGKATEVAAGYGHTCALVGGGVQCWGLNWYGQLGDGGTTTSLSPKWVSGLGAGSGVTVLVSSRYHTCAKVKGALRCWGKNEHGQLGDGTLKTQVTPVPVKDTVGQVSSIATAEEHTCVVGSDLVQCWGRADAGQLGRGKPLSSTTPVQVQAAGTAVTGGAAGNDFTCILGGTSKTARCWGRNAFGQLGDGTQVTTATPQTVKGLVGITGLTCGRDHTCAVVSSGSSGAGARCWGRGTSGQLGNGKLGTSGLPVAVSSLKDVKQLASSYNHTCAVTGSGVSCWGQNGSGQLGDGTTTNRTTPAPVKPAGAATGATAVAAGRNFSCLAAAGGLACCGDNYDGQCAQGASSNPLMTVSGCPALPAGSGVTGVAAAGHHACAVVKGKVMCWGNNWHGQVGDGTYTERTSPVEVKGLATSGVTVTRIAVGGGHACALAGGKVSCWGANPYGQLGDGTRTASAQPVAVSGISGATHVFAGSGHSCAVVSGKLWCWGSNALGALGSGWTGPVIAGLVAAWHY
jgi:alpha-tubulin suppressor-like RCC1 family protein